MLTNADTLYLSVQIQLLLTVCLVTLLWALYTRLLQFEFFRWWAWAWTACAAYLASATVSLYLGPTWTPAKASVIVLMLLSGFLQPVLLVFGGLSWRRPTSPSRRLYWWGIGLACLAALVCFLASVAARVVPLTSFVVRNIPRTLALSAALLFCCAVFWRQFRRSRSYAAAITGMFCLSYAFDQFLYFLSFSEIMSAQWHLHFPGLLHQVANLEMFSQHRLLFFDLVDTCGICVGMIVLLVERYQHTASELLVSERRRLELAVAKASLETEIKDRQRAEQELKEHAMYMDALIANIPLGIVIKDQDQLVRFCNPAFESMFLYTQAEIQGKNIDALIAPHDRQEAALLSDTVQKGGVVHTTARRCRKDGTLIDVELHGIKVFSGDSFVGAFAIYQDISDRRKAEEKLAAMRNRLARAQEEERARIARDLHDDAGQRLALLSIDLEQLKQASMKLKSSLTQQLESLVKAASEITSDVHNVSRRLHPSQVELLGLAAAVSNFCKDFAARNSMEIEFVQTELREKPPQDAALCLFRVLQEAIRNVQKHSGTRHALVELDEISGSLRLRVSDQGAGFDSESADFSQGLGLLSMEERLRSLGGELFVHSRPGGGTCIEACIPLSPEVPA